MRTVRSRSFLPILLLLGLFPLPARPAGNEGAEQLDFGVRAAKKGLWREALFRWEKAAKVMPDNPRILNNLAVAYETAGEYEKADKMYKEALRLAPDNRDIRQNHDLFSAYYKELLSRKEHEESAPPAPPAPESPKAPEEKPPDAPPR
jgi:tetratricopeptide (TPR) repeat protein